MPSIIHALLTSSSANNITAVAPFACAMVLQLLPASAKAFSERAKPNVVLNTRAETWLTQTLKRINKQKRPLNSVSQHRACLEDTLSGENAIWSLASIMLPRAPKSELKQDDNKLLEALSNYQIIHIEGYVVHIDMVSQHEVAFKLTQDTIDALVEYHKDIFSVDAAANYSYDWPEKDKQLKKLQADYVQAINRYVFRTHVRALEGLEDEGAGELLEGRSQDVKTAVENLFQPLLPPPPKIVDVIAAPGYMAQFWAPQYLIAHPVQMPHSHQYLPRPIEPWRVLGSTPSPTSSHGEIHPPAWSTSAYPETTHMPSPTPSYSQPTYSQPYTCSSQYTSVPAMAPVQSLPLPLPSQLVAQQCSTSVGNEYGGYWGMNDMTPQYPISI